MNKKFVYISCFAFLVAFFAWTQYAVKFPGITTTSSLDVIENELKDADESTLVIFDCDDVLIHQTDVVFSPENENRLKKFVLKKLAENPELVKDIKKYKGMIYVSVDQILLDERMPEFVKNLQDRNIKTIVLTRMRNEKLNGEWSVKLRIKELQNFGFDFSKNWNVAPKSFGNIGNSPHYEEGIICSKPETKGNALKMFLDYTKLKPSKIVFIDDKLENLKDVAKVAKDLKIPFKGFEYTAKNNHPYKYEFSEKRLNFQLDYLIKNKKWLSDDEAETMMSSK